ncbi:hypothetical protein ACMA1D_00210 [Streptomyces sp. 796.1]|uniref:hypothetical protein n=1 Tax=Streptomyces sp. 796.1 TaxID=3163029 RepID=UPI0039C9F2B2
MTNPYLPPQPPPQSPNPPPPVVAPHASEATRLLCTGTYLDAAYRDRVIEELYRAEHRTVAPSLGFDATRVLAHAVRARRVELAWLCGVLGLLVVGAAVSGGWLLVLVLPGLLLTFGQRLRSGAGARGRGRRSAFALHWGGRFLLVYLVFQSLRVGFGRERSEKDKPKKDTSDKGQTNEDQSEADQLEEGWPTQTGDGQAEVETSSDGGEDSSPFDLPSPSDLLFPDSAFTPDSPFQAWSALAVLLAMAVCVAGQQMHFTCVLRGELSPERFPELADDPAERIHRGRFARAKRLIRREQHAPLVRYHEARPFCGAGIAYDTWVLAVELRPNPAAQQQPLDNATVLAAVRPFLEQLREVSGASGQRNRVVRDRLRQLQIDECVFLPVAGLSSREQARYGPSAFEQHRLQAIEEGGEMRRHFLRIRVHGWEDELVVTVFVRVHTQGRMLMLEVAPHVLLPIREDFKDADHEAYRLANQNLFGKSVNVLTQTASAPGQALMAFGRRAVHNWRWLTGESRSGELPEGPALSVRELAAEPSGSLFQTMDVDRYLRSVQDRIAYGVKTALVAAGYQTDEFAQKVIYISNGGINIDSVDRSTFAVGDHARATATGGQPPRPTAG